MRIVLIFTFVFFVKIAYSQQFKLEGVVKDSLTGEVLPGATVSLNFGEMAVSTDANGKFAFLIPSQEISMVVRYIGYVPYRKVIKPTSNMVMMVNIIRVSQELDEIVIASTTKSENIRRPLLGVASLNVKTLRKIPTVLGEMDVLRGLQMLPGVSSVGEASNGVNIRGGTTDQNLILLDGAPIFNPTHMFGLFSAFPSDAVSSFDLYKGNVPARYGGRAASVLDVSLAQPSLDQFKMQGGISLVSNRLKTEIPLVKDKLGLLVSGRGAFNDWAIPLFNKDLADLKAKFYDSSAKLFGKINKNNTISASAYYSYDFFQTEALGAIADINASSTQYKYSTLNLSGTWFTSFSDKLNLQTTVVSSVYQPSLLLPEFESTNVVEIAQGINYKQAKTNLNYYLGKNSIELALDATHYDLNPGELRPGSSQSINAIKSPDENALELGIGIEDQIEFSKNLTLSIGLRYSRFANSGPAKRLVYGESERKEETIIDSLFYSKGQNISQYSGFEPRIGLRYALNESNSIKFGYNILRQYMQVISNTTTPLPTSRWKTSDTYIKPQISTLYTAGFFHDFSESVYEFSSEIYYRETQNTLDYKPGASFLLQEYPEQELLQGINKSYGLELMIAKKKGEVAGWVNYTFARSFNKINEGPSINQQVNFGNWYAANYDRPHTFNGTLVINQGEHHDFSFNFTYSTGRPYTTPQGYINIGDTQFPFYTVRNNSRIPDYHRLDFAWNIYNPSMKDRKYKSHWTFTVYNLYGRKNAYSVFFKNEDRVSKTYRLSVFGAPIVSLAYNFNLN